jgi:hypothetical protein
MDKTIEKEACSIADYLQRIKEIRCEWNPFRSEAEELWYRGVSKKAHFLVPGAYRAEAEAYGYDETTLLETFRMQGMALTNPRPQDTWEWYFLAQHHRLPTRLLDWTENALTALYFAICHQIGSVKRSELDQLARAEPSDHKYDDNSPVVWILDAGSLNAYSYGSACDVVFTPGGPLTEHYSPDKIMGRLNPEEFEARGQRVSNAYPIAIYPYRANGRIVAQQGTFTLHGTERVPLEQLPKKLDRDSPRLARILLDQNRIYHLLDELDVVGVHSLSLFPDLDRVAERARWLYE